MKRKNKNDGRKRSAPYVDLESKDYPFSHIDPEFVNELLDMGYFPKEISEIYGCSKETLKRQMNLKGHPYDGRDLYQRPDVSIEDVVNLHENGHTSKDIARIFDMGVIAVRKRLKDGGVKVNREVDGEEIYKLHKKGLSNVKISKLTGYSLYNISKELKNKGIVRKQLGGSISESRVIKEFENGMKPYRIAKEYGVTAFRVQSILVRNGYELNRRPFRKDVTNEKVVKLYDEENLTIKEIAKKLKCSVLTVYSRLWGSGGELRGHERRTNRRRFDLPEDEIIERRKGGVSLSKLSNEYGTTIPTLRKILDEDND
tara:strand:- start:662 stop:1603 length:942 start_codon:yes stop_codon:yes gene_type:complete